VTICSLTANSKKKNSAFTTTKAYITPSGFTVVPWAIFQGTQLLNDGFDTYFYRQTTLINITLNFLDYKKTVHALILITSLTFSSKNSEFLVSINTTDTVKHKCYNYSGLTLPATVWYGRKP
jgi:hypothetical protein